MTDQNATTTRSHRIAREHLERVARRRAAALEHTATFTPNVPQEPAQAPVAPPTEDQP